MPGEWLWNWFLVLITFGIGMRLSALFSGIETAFYRIGHIKLSIDSQAGDQQSTEILKFLRHPAYFVATTLIGNNVANYIVTTGVSMGTVALFGYTNEWLDMGMTLLVTPFIFVGAELIPKNLCYTAPRRFLFRDWKWFRLTYWLLIPVSFPLVLITRLLQKLGGETMADEENILGRRRIVQAVSHGQKAGVIEPVQNQLVESVLKLANESIGQRVLDIDTSMEVSSDADRQTIVEKALKYGLSHMVIRHPNEPQPHSYYVINEVRFTNLPLYELRRPLCPLQSEMSALQAITLLSDAEADCGIVLEEGKVCGLIYRRALAELILRQMESNQKGRRRVPVHSYDDTDRLM